jgi:hypothetical protein
MITITKEEKRTAVIWSCIFGFFIANFLSFLFYLLVPSSWDWDKKTFLIIDLGLILALCCIITTLVLFGLKFSSSIRINR